MNMPLTVSVVIRNKNEAEYLRLVLEALRHQEVNPLDIVIVDNESEDHSLQIAEKFGAKIVTLPRKSFTYGRCANVGVREAKGDICIILSAHALPLGPYFITECLKPFLDAQIAMVRCVMTGKKNDLTRWLHPEILRYPIELEEVLIKGGMTTCCAIRKTVWQEIPFDEEVDIIEDKLWGFEVLKRGYALYSPCPAFYFYMKKIQPLTMVFRNAREATVVYEKTGRTPKGSTIIKNLLIEFFYGGPVSLIRYWIVAIVKAFLLFKLKISAGVKGMRSRYFCFKPVAKE